MIDKELLKILACPLCKAEVKLEGNKIVCTACGRRYPIKGGIPVMLIDEAEIPVGKQGPSDKRKGNSPDLSGRQGETIGFPPEKNRRFELEGEAEEAKGDVDL